MGYGIARGDVGRVEDFALWPADIETTFQASVPKLYIFKPEDEDTLRILQELYPAGQTDLYESDVDGRDFMLFYVVQ